MLSYCCVFVDKILVKCSFPPFIYIATDMCICFWRATSCHSICWLAPGIWPVKVLKVLDKYDGVVTKKWAWRNNSTWGKIPDTLITFLIFEYTLCLQLFSLHLVHFELVKVGLFSKINLVPCPAPPAVVDPGYPKVGGGFKVRRSNFAEN